MSCVRAMPKLSHIGALSCLRHVTTYPMEVPMSQRLNVMKLAPEAYQAFFAVEKYLHACGLPVGTIELVKLRASQINGCGYCVDMHSRSMKQAGESDERLWSVATWR